MSQGPETCYWWQVRKGPTKRKYWGWVDDNVNSRLERAWCAGAGDTTAVIDGWCYYYDLVLMVQLSPGEARTERAIRRVNCGMMSDGDSDQDSVSAGRWQ